MQTLEDLEWIGEMVAQSERPPEIPGAPSRTYKYSEGWNGFADWLEERINDQHFCPMKKQKRWSMGGLKSREDWKMVHARNDLQTSQAPLG